MAASTAAATAVSGEYVDSVTEHSRTRYTFPCWKSMDNFLSEGVQITGRSDDMIPRDDLLSRYKEYCQTKCVKSGLAKDFWRYLDTRGIHANIIKNEAGHHIIAFVGLLSAHPHRDRPKCTHTSCNDSFPSKSSSNSFIEFLGEEVKITRTHTDLVICWNLFKHYENFCNERKVVPASNYIVRRILTILGVKTYRAEKIDGQGRTYMYSGLQWVKEDLTAAASSCLQKSFSSSCVQENLASKSTPVESITANAVAANTQTKDTLLDQQVMDHFLVKSVQITGKSDDMIPREDLFSSYKKHCQIYRVKPGRERDFYHCLDTRGIHANIMKNKAGHHVIGFSGLLWTHPRRDCPSRISTSSNTSIYHYPFATSARDSFIQFLGEELKITKLTSDLVKCKDLFSNYEKFCCEKNRIQADNVFAGNILASLGVKSNVRKGVTRGQGQNCMYSGLQWVRKELTAANSSCLQQSFNSSCPQEILASKNTSVRCFKADAVTGNITNDTVPGQKFMDDYLSARMKITGRNDDIVPREDVLSDYKKYCQTNRVKLGFARDFCHYLDTKGIDVKIRKNQAGYYIIAFVGLLWAQPPVDCPSPCNSSSVSNDRLSIKIARDSFVKFLGKEVKITKVSTDLVSRKELFSKYVMFCENKVSANKVLKGRILSILGVKCITRRGGINGRGQEYMYSGLQWVKKNLNAANSSLQNSFSSSCPQENSAPINTSVEFIKDDAVIENNLNDYPYPCNKFINDFLSTRVQITGRSDDVIPREDLFSSYKRYCRINRIKAHPARYFWHYLDERGIPANLIKNQVGHHIITYSGLLWVQPSRDCPSLTCNSSSTYNNYRSISNARDYFSFVDFFREEMKISRLPSDIIKSEDLFRNYEKFCRERNKVPSNQVFIGHILDSLGVKATTRTGSSQNHIYSGLEWIRKDVTTTNFTCLKKSSSISSCLPKIMKSKGTFMHFYVERLIFTGIETDLVVLQELMTKYKEFCQDRQVNPLTAHSVGRIIRRLGVKKAVRLKNKSERMRYAYEGLAWIKSDANPDYDLLTHYRNRPQKVTLADKKKQDLAEEHGTSSVKLREDGLEDSLSVWTTADAAEFLTCVNIAVSSHPFSVQVSKEP